MGIINTGSFPKLLWPGLNKIFGTEYAQYPQQWSQIFAQETSNKNYEEDVGITGLGLAAKKTEGNAISYDAMKQNYTAKYVHVEYGLGFIVTQIELEDNLYDVVSKKNTRALAFSMVQTKENVGANILNNAFSAATANLGGDGVALCSGSHPIAGSTFSNLLSPAADLSETALEEMLIQVAGFTDDRGLKIALQGTKLVVPRQLQFDAKRILGNSNQPDTAERNINAMYAMGSLPQGYIVNQYLTDPDAFFILTNCPDGLKCFQRRAVAFDTDGDFDTSNCKFKATERYSFYWTDPRGIIGSAGA